MKKSFLYTMTLCALLWSCGHSHNHDHEHEHGHAATEHNHDHAHAEEQHNHAHEHTEEQHNHAHAEEQHVHEHKTDKHSDSDEHNHSDEIVMSVEMAENAGVKVSKVVAGTFHNVLTVSGHIIASQGDEASAVANMAGVVTMTKPLTAGRQVRKGEVLFSISADKLQDGDPAKKAQVVYQTAKEEYERAQRLLQDKLITLSDFNAIKERYETARIAYEATASNANGRVTVTSPIDGYILRCNVRPGEFVTTGQLLADIAQSNRLYLQADVPLRHSHTIRTITQARFKTEYSEEVFDTQSLKGKLLSASNTASESSAYLPLTFEIDNNGELIAGSFATIHLLSGERQNIISLPLGAITEQQGINFVYIQNDPTCYSKREVRLGMSDGHRVEILSGLHPGETVVTDGAIHVRLASASNSIPGHSHAH